MFQLLWPHPNAISETCNQAEVSLPLSGGEMSLSYIKSESHLSMYVVAALLRMFERAATRPFAKLLA